MPLEKVRKSQRGKMETKTGQGKGGLAGQLAHLSISEQGLPCVDIPPTEFHCQLTCPPV